MSHDPRNPGLESSSSPALTSALEHQHQVDYLCMPDLPVASLTNEPRLTQSTIRVLILT